MNSGKAGSFFMHEQHRQRMKERYLREGFENFATHELIEMLLYYSQPRKDTNPCAHALLEQFGSLKGIMEATVDDLTTVEGVGEHSAILLKLVAELLRRYAIDLGKKIGGYDTLTKVCDFIYRRFIGIHHERLYLMIFNNRMSMTDCYAIADGTINTSDAPIRLIAEKCLQRKASSVIVAHNHPDGLLVPSTADLDFTDALQETLDLINVSLVEHLIVNNFGVVPIMRDHCTVYSGESVRAKLGEDFFRNFYDVDRYRAPVLFEDQPKTTDELLYDD